MNRALVTYVTTVVVLAAVILAVLTPSIAWGSRDLYLLWLAALLAAEHLWLSSITGAGSHSMVSAFNFVVIALLPTPAAVWIVSLAALVASVVFQRRVWYRALFNGAQMVLTTVLASGVFHLLGGDLSRVEQLLDWHSILLWALAGIVYHAVNTSLVAGAISLQTGQEWWPTWRENFGYRDELMSSGALFLMSPIALAVFLAMDQHHRGFYGLVLFYVPLLFIRDAHARYIDLVKAQEKLIFKERMAAKGDIAAQIAHDLNNFLSPIMGRAQMLMLQADTLDKEKVEKHARIIFENVANMKILTKGLADLSWAEAKMMEASLNQLAMQTVEFLRPQKKFREISFRMALDDTLPTVTMDPAQIQQVLMNLLSNAADALEGRPSPEVTLTTRLDAGGKHGVLLVADNGIGIPEENLAKIFEPQFTTKGLQGHGFGLATCFNILEKHRGSLKVQSEPGQGAVFTVTLPVHRARGN